MLKMIDTDRLLKIAKEKGFVGAWYFFSQFSDEGSIEETDFVERLENFLINISTKCMQTEKEKMLEKIEKSIDSLKNQ